MTIYFYKTQELNGSNYVKLPLRSNAILNIQNDDKYCFIWSILAYMFAVLNNSHRVANYKKYFNKLNIEGFDFENGFKCNDVKQFEKLNNLAINIFELYFYQDDNKIWKHKLITLEISDKDNSDYEIDLLIYKNHYILIKKLHVFLGKPDCKFICRRCLSSYSNQKVLEKPKFKCSQQEITSNRTSNESHIYWKKYFHKIPLYFRIYADFEFNNEIDNSNMGKKTINIYKQNPVCNGYYIISKLNDVLKSGYYHSPLGYENVKWFVDEMIKLENKMNF